jgi:hypothetical protein
MVRDGESEGSMTRKKGEGDDVGWLQADPEKVKDSYVAVIVPSLNRDGAPVDHELWRNQTVREVSTLFGGATSFKGYGGWLDQEREGKVIEEEISLVVSFIRREEWSKTNVCRLKDFLFRMGRETEQGAIGLIVLGRYLEIPEKEYSHE